MINLGLISIPCNYHISEDNLLVKHVVVDAHFDKCFEISRHQHHWTSDTTKLTHLKVVSK